LSPQRIGLQSNSKRPVGLPCKMALGGTMTMPDLAGDGGGSVCWLDSGAAPYVMSIREAGRYS